MSESLFEKRFFRVVNELAPRKFIVDAILRMKETTYTVPITM